MDDGKKAQSRGLVNNGQGMLIAVALLLVIGCANVFSATFVSDAMNGSGWNNYFTKHVAYLIISSLIGVFVYYQVDYTRLKEPKVLLLICGVILAALIAIFAVGTVVNGARRWIFLGSVSIQPSEFAKLGAILWTAAFTTQRLQRNKTIEIFEHPRRGVLQGFTKSLWAPCAFSILTILQPDMGTAVLVSAFPFIILVCAGLNMRKVGAAMTFVGVVFAVLAWTSPYRRERLLSLWDPWSHSKDLGYQSVQGLIAVGSGGLSGQGFGQGTSKFFYLPEAHTDFAFAVWAQEWGLFGALLIILLVCIFTYYGIRIAQNAKDYFGTLTAYGITLLISVQALFNMIMVCGSLPVTGVPLPFVSYGGSSLLMNILAVAILANIAKLSPRKKEIINPEPPRLSLREETRSRYKTSRKG